jgi:uncharacterized small protein (DUF1192 family)
LTTRPAFPADPLADAVLHLLDRIDAQDRQIAAMQAEINKLKTRADAAEWRARTNRKVGK